MAEIIVEDKITMEELVKNIEIMADIPPKIEIPILIEDDCNPLLKVSGVCVCISCSRKGICKVEIVNRHTKCQRFVRACSIRSMEMSAQPKCADFILEEFFDHLERKYL